ncbi:hypothetical protein KSF_072910 [Reticulibacter mediterranei]|uniref:Uncharacterized protein n=1 Tax=Reticulibacter mediterranei TaxID=2778369 RepID=A0A8J3IRG5_9CHLR|nr:hypothetical protein KSF_072910 [Reticulibacter mediterranei]
MVMESIAHIVLSMIRGVTGCLTKGGSTEKNFTYTKQASGKGLQ